MAPRRTFGGTWWGQAWIDALEQRSRLDPNRLPRGRTYARHSRVGAITVEPGEVRAPVLGSRSAAYRVRIRVRPFTDAEWDAALDAIAAKAGHAAALLDGELAPGIVDDLLAAGIELLPVAGEVRTACSCPDWANPCKHAAAVCYLIADLLDEDPFVVLQLRGRARDAVLAGLRARRSGAAVVPALASDATDHGVEARFAFAARSSRALPRPPLPPAHAGLPAPLAVDPPAQSEIAAGDLTTLAADAAQRAWELATGAGDGGLTLSHSEDLARRAAAALGTADFDALAARSGLGPVEVVRIALAWEHGGPGGVAVIGEEWDPPTDVMQSARAAVGFRVRVEANRISVGKGRQIRYGQDGLWYPMEKRRGGWELAGPPDADPAVAALTP